MWVKLRTRCGCEQEVDRVGVRYTDLLMPLNTSVEDPRVGVYHSCRPVRRRFRYAKTVCEGLPLFVEVEE